MRRREQWYEDEADDAKAAAIELVIRTTSVLHGLTLKELKRRASAAGAEEEAPATLSTAIHNPATGAAIGEVRAATTAEIDGALAAARPWAARTALQGGQLPRGAARGLAAHCRFKLAG